MMHKNFTHRRLPIFVAQHSCMKFYTGFAVQQKP